MTNGASSETSTDPKKTKTETIAFRLSSTLIDELRRDAELEKVSLNAFVTKIFSNHIQIGMI
jgi:predicted HicB family RNase H-like nuclease